MKKIILLLAMLTGFTTGTARCQEKSDMYAYLTQTANAIYDIESRSVELKPEEVAEVAARACKTLERLLGDKEFIDDLYRMAKATPDHREHNRQLSRDLTLFIDSFLRPEVELLKKAGLSAAAIQHISWSASFLHDSLGKDADPKRILDAIDKLRNDICSTATTIAKGQDDAKVKVERRKRIKKWALGIGGVVVIAVDATSSAPSGGLAVASFTLGGAFIGSAISD